MVKIYRFCEASHGRQIKNKNKEDIYEWGGESRAGCQNTTLDTIYGNLPLLPHM